MGDRKVFFRTPAYDGRVEADTMMSVMRCICGDSTSQYDYDVQALSALCLNFNMLWAQALNTRASNGWTHFAMLHADMATAMPNWLEFLMDELDRTGADVLSVVAPFKDGSGLTSTGYDNGQQVVRLTLKQIHELPVTFGIEDTPYPEHQLVVNTGMWVCDFTKPWVEKVWFQMVDQIVPCPDGIFRVVFKPEDWEFSRMCNELGLKVMATRGVPIRHIGRRVFKSDEVYGLAVDPLLEVQEAAA